MSATARQVVKSCPSCFARHEVGRFDQTLSTQIASAASNNILPSKKSTEIETENSLTGESSVKVVGENDTVEINELPFTVTSEVDSPVEQDPDLDFDLGTIFSHGKNLMEDCDILKAQGFWERVEILVISPPSENEKKKEDGRGRCKHYTIIAVDSFSKWPEVKKLDKINEQTISQFIIQLICRFGIMKQLVVLQNEVLINHSLVIPGITQNLSMFNVIVISENYNPYDENWTRICKCVTRFVQSNSSTWSSCLDLCLIPLRNSIAPKTDYTPAFVVTGREPMLPSFLFPHIDSSNSAEKMLNQEQIDSACDSLMSRYQECIEADVKTIVVPSDSNPVKLLNPFITIKEESSGIRRSGKKVTVSHHLAEYEHVISQNISHDEEDMVVDNADVDHSFDDVKGEELTQFVPFKKRKCTEFDIQEVQAHSDPSLDTNKISGSIETAPKTTFMKRNIDGEDVLNKMDSCTFYQVLKLYIEKSQYPLNSPETFRRIVRKAREIYSMKDGKLMYNYKNKTKKTVLMTMKERLQILNEIHTSTDGHLPKSRMVDLMEQRLLYWKNYIRDVDAYVKACPICKHGKTRRCIKKKSEKIRHVSKDMDDEDEWAVCEKYQGRISSFYPDLIEYLDSGATPCHLSRSELVIFKKKAKNFKLIKGELYFFEASGKIECRKVLVNEDHRYEIMRKAHGDTHQPASVMLTEIKKHYYWRPMLVDIENYVGNCCQVETESYKDRTNLELIRKVRLFAKHFNGEDICSEPVDLDSLFPEMGISTDVADSESLDHKTGHLVKKIDQRQEIVSDDIVRATSTTTTVAGSALDQQIMPTVSISEAGPSAEMLIVTDSSSITPFVNINTSSEPYMAISASSAMKVEQDVLKSENVNDNHLQEAADADDLSQLEQGVCEEQEDNNEEGEEEELLALDQNEKSKKRQGVKMRCEICQKIVKGENNLKEHMYKHNGIKPFSCEVCNKKLTTIKGMRIHMRKHTGHRPYLCNICGRGFPQSASLRYHIKTHDKGATLPVFCEICDRVFTSEHRLNKHKRFKHTEKRPVTVWKCDACGKHFTAKRSLKRHKEAHQGIRRYVCEFCNRSFFRKEYLTYHLDSHYKGNPTMAHLASKRKRRINQRQKEENTNMLSIYTVDPDDGQEKMYTQLVEVTNPHRWSEEPTEVPTVFTLTGGTLLQ